MEDRITYEVWLLSVGEKWVTVADSDGNDYFSNKKKAMLAASKAAGDDDAVEAVVIERRPVLFLNGAGKNRPVERSEAKKLTGVNLGDAVRSVDAEQGRDPGADDGRAGDADPVVGQAGDGTPGA